MCPSHGNLRDIWTSGAEFIDIERNEYVAGTRCVGDVISCTSLADKLQLLYHDRDLLKKLGGEAYELSTEDKFSWKIVANKVYKVLAKANANRLSYIS